MRKSIFSRNPASIVVILLGIAISPLAHTQAYKSTGEKGVTEYSDRAPISGQVERVEVAPSPPSADADQSRPTVDEVNQALDEIAEQRNQDAANKVAEKEAAKQQKAACEQSRRWLDQLELYPPNRRLVVYPDGTSKRVSWEEMQSLVEDAREQVRINCGEH